MAKYIELEVALALIRPDKPEDEKATITIATAKKFVRSGLYRIPAADVAPVVRCENCMDGIESDDNKYIICCRFGIGMEFDDFCSRGDRKNECNVCLAD